MLVFTLFFMEVHVDLSDIILITVSYVDPKLLIFFISISLTTPINPMCLEAHPTTYHKNITSACLIRSERYCINYVLSAGIYCRYAIRRICFYCLGCYV